jgi:hypothetical protein
MDKRHNAKVDYNELKNIINKEFSNIGKWYFYWKILAF